MDATMHRTARSVQLAVIHTPSTSVADATARARGAAATLGDALRRALSPRAMPAPQPAWAG